MQRQQEEVISQEARVEQEKIALGQLEKEVVGSRGEISTINSLVHNFSRRISEVSSTQCAEPSPLGLAMPPAHLLDQIRNAADGALQLVQHNAAGSTIDGEAVTKQLVNVA